MFTFKKYDNQIVFLQFFFFIFLKHHWHKLMRKADISLQMNDVTVKSPEGSILAECSGIRLTPVKFNTVSQSC